MCTILSVCTGYNSTLYSCSYVMVGIGLGVGGALAALALVVELEGTAGCARSRRRSGASCEDRHEHIWSIEKLFDRTWQESTVE